jgi:hypothetical protein
LVGVQQPLLVEHPTKPFGIPAPRRHPFDGTSPVS